MAKFRLVAPYEPTGDQPQAIAALERGLRAGERCQTLLGVTGSGKTFTMANVIAEVGPPDPGHLATTRPWPPSSTASSSGFFPDNAVEYFVSYYDYYQPEAYVPATNTYIEKDAIDQRGDRAAAPARHQHRCSPRDDVIVVACVSCIYGLGIPEDFRDRSRLAGSARQIGRGRPAAPAGATSSTRATTSSCGRGTFRVRGDVVEIVPAYEERAIVRVEFFGDEIERSRRVDPLTGRSLSDALEQRADLPGQALRHRRGRSSQQAVDAHRAASWRSAWPSSNAPASCSRRSGSSRAPATTWRCCSEIGYCSGIENYSRYLDRTRRRASGRPACSTTFPRTSC